MGIRERLTAGGKEESIFSTARRFGHPIVHCALAERRFIATVRCWENNPNKLFLMIHRQPIYLFQDALACGIGNHFAKLAGVIRIG
jgi:hypothetical protein